MSAFLGHSAQLGMSARAQRAAPQRGALQVISCLVFGAAAASARWSWSFEHTSRSSAMSIICLRLGELEGFCAERREQGEGQQFSAALKVALLPRCAAVGWR